MSKSPTQRLLEAQRGVPIRDIIIGELEQHRGQLNQVWTAAAGLGVSGDTLRRWCADLGIDVGDYRGAAEAQQPCP